MAKDTFHFPHDFNARNDEKMLSLRDAFSMEGIGVYWCLLEVMSESSERSISFSKLPVIARELWIELEKLQEIISFCCTKDVQLFVTNRRKFWSTSLRKRLEIKDIKRDKARQSALDRWDANALPTHSERNAKESKENKESKEVKKEEFTFPPELLSINGFLETWERWEKSRKEKKKPLTNSQREAQCKNLVKWGNAVAVLEYSIAGGYQGLFEQKNNSNGKSTSSYNNRLNYDHAEAERSLDKLMGQIKASAAANC